MGAYSKYNFCLPAGPDTVSLTLKDKNGKIKFTLYNNTETSFSANNNIIIIKNDGDTKDIILDFGDSVEAIQALVILNTQFSIIRHNYNIKNSPTTTKTYIFSNGAGANQPIADSQVLFTVPNSEHIDMVFINGILITEYSFLNNVITLSIPDLDYNIESTDVMLVKYTI